MGIALSVLLRLAKANWKLIAIVVIAAATYFWIHGLYSDIATQAQTITELTAANKTLKDNNDKLETAIKANNDAIDKIAKGTEATNKAFSTLNSTVKAQSGSLEDRLRRILQEKKPQTCEDTILYLIQASREMK